WEAPPGSSLLVSALVGAPAPELAQLTTVCAALAAADACADVSGVHPSLKWPNDLLVGDEKLGGILAELLVEILPPSTFPARSASFEPRISAPMTTPGAQQSGRDHQPRDHRPRRFAFVAVVVGLGLNIDWGDAELPDGATSLARVAGARRVNREALLTSYLGHLAHRCAALDRPGARAGLLDDYRRACSTLGREVSVDLGVEQLVGTATAIADNGNLVVTTDAGAHEVAAGDVAHLNAP
ncbi:MAG: hypothetical protein M3159_07330, partial [Actinomycetota bacterium]|nr:hypothetical protein [Actinomycetota bacterium]